MIEELYRPYNDLLKAGLGLDWFEVERIYTEIGGTPGIFPDVALLLERLMSRPDVSSLAEFGSGVSTLYLARASVAYGKKFVSVEEDASWLDKTRSLLSRYGMGSGCVSLYDGTTPLPECDAVFLDAIPGLRRDMLLGGVEWLRKRAWILLDDYNFPVFAEAIDGFQRRATTRAGVVYHPVSGRDDHVVFISTVLPARECEEWLEGWLP